MRTKKNHSNGSAEKTVKAIRRATRRRYAAEEKIRMVLEGLRGEIVSLRWERIDLDRRILRSRRPRPEKYWNCPSPGNDLRSTAGRSAKPPVR